MINNTIKLFNLTFQCSISVASTLEDSLSSNSYSLVFGVLWLGIVISAMGISYRNLGPVHKVLSLLFLSLFTVSLWMYVTQFLFIYLVYILAFVGAVLILFLSVVLILPISAVNYNVTGSLVLLSNTKVTMRPEGMSDLKYTWKWTIPELFSVSFWVVLFFIAIICLTVTHIIRFCFDSVYCEEWQGWMYYSVISNLDTQDKSVEFVLNRKLFFESLTGTFFIKYWRENAFPFSLPDASVKWYQFAYQVIYGKQRSVNKLEFLPSLMGLNLLLSVQKLLIICGAMCIIVLQTQSRFLITVAKQLKFKLAQSVSTYFHLYAELFTQIILTGSSFLIMIPPPRFDAPVIRKLPENEADGGLSQIKALLYDEIGLFSLLTTLVLLVALIGAAVMTRNKK